QARTHGKRVRRLYRQSVLPDIDAERRNGLILQFQIHHRLYLVTRRAALILLARLAGGFQRFPREFGVERLVKDARRAGLERLSRPGHARLATASRFGFCASGSRSATLMTSRAPGRSKSTIKVEH